jgi:hypothetical protein
MLVDVDEPIESYKEQVFLGMDLPTSIVFAAAIVGCIGYIGVSAFVLEVPLAMGTYTSCIPGAAIVFLGKKLLMGKESPFEKRRKRKYTKNHISFYSTECAARLEEHLAGLSSDSEQGKEMEEDIRRIMQQSVLAIVGVVLMAAAVLIVAVLFKKGYV